MTVDIPKRTCIRCKKLHPETLYSESSGLCVYCKADDVDALPEPTTTDESESKAEELSLEEKAKAELALRFLTRKRLLPFVERFNPDYQAGWVHKDICRRLEQFSQDVV